MKEKICGIYKITSPVGKIYIGQALNIPYRFSKYKSLTCKNQRYLYHSLLKHGFESHLCEIIEVCDENKLNEREKCWIKHFDTFDTPHGLNLTDGGHNGRHTQATKEKLRILAGSRKHTDEALKKMSIASTGRKHTDEFKLALSERNRGNKYGIGVKRNHTQETRKKMSESKIGKKQTQEHAIKRSISQRKLILNLETGIYHFGINDALLSIKNKYKYEYLIAMLNGARRNKTAFIYA